MKYIMCVRIMVLLTVAGLVSFDGQRACGANTPLIGTKADVNRAPEEVGSVGETRAATASVLGLAPDQKGQPSVGAYNENDATSFAKTMSALDLSFSHQQSEVVWSGHAEVRARETFRPLTNKDTNLISVHCRATLCRVELLHATVAEFHNFMETLKTGVVTSGWKGPGLGGMVETNEDGKVRSVFYLAKEGTTLPLPSPVEARAADDTNDPRSR